MAAYWKILKKAISDVIKENGNQEITGPLLQQALLSTISSLGADAAFAGVATLSTNPGLSDGPRFWIASEPGIYPNFGLVEVPANTIGIISTTGSSGVSYDANTIKRSGEAIDNSGRLIQSADFTSLVFDVKANDPVQIPLATSVGANKADIKILKSDGSVDISIGAIATDRFVSPVSGQVWAEYYISGGRGSSIVFTSGAKVSVGNIGDFSIKLIDITESIREELVGINASIEEIDNRVTVLENAGELKVYDANTIKRSGEALANDGRVLQNADFTSLVFDVKANDPVQIPLATSVGANKADIKILKSDGSVDISVGAIANDKFISPVTGQAWAEYYISEGRGSSIVFASGAQVVVGEQPATHKKVIWIGTSIPAGNGAITGTYPLQIKANLGIQTLYNNSIGSSGIIKLSGYLGNGRDGLDLSETVAEKEARYRSKVQDGTITEATLNNYKAASYERRLIPYIDGSVDTCDTVIIDHGYNDRDTLATEINNDVVLSNKDRSSFIGAFNYLIDKIYAVNPKIQIIVIGFYMKDNYNGNGWEMHGHDIDIVLKKLSAFYNFMYIPTYSGSCINPANFMRMCPDKVHPHSDTAGTAVKNIADFLTNSLRDII